MNEHIQPTTVKRGFEEIAPLWEIIQGKGYIGGSYAAYMVAPDDGLIVSPNDIDVFLLPGHEMTDFCDFHGELRDLGLVYWANTPIARTYHPYPLHLAKIKRDVQLINPHPDWKTFPDDIIESFDLDVCRAVIVAPDCAYADVNVGSKDGKYLRINDPLKSLKRALKYHHRGVEFSDWELLKLFQAWEQYPADKRESLIAQNKPELEQHFDDEDQGSYDGYNWYDDDDYFECE